LDLYIPVGPRRPLVDVLDFEWERIRWRTPVINSVVVGVTSFEDFIRTVAASYEGLEFQAGRIILESLTNDDIEITFEGSFPGNSSDGGPPEEEELDDNDDFQSWLESALEINYRDVALNIVMKNPVGYRRFHPIRRWRLATRPPSTDEQPPPVPTIDDQEAALQDPPSTNDEETNPPSDGKQIPRQDM
jgi:hypothetical protein